MPAVINVPDLARKMPRQPKLETGKTRVRQASSDPERRYLSHAHGSVEDVRRIEPPAPALLALAKVAGTRVPCPIVRFQVRLNAANTLDLNRP